MTHYSELFERESVNAHGFVSSIDKVRAKTCCDTCIIPSNYEGVSIVEQAKKRTCNFCFNLNKKAFKGEEAFLADLALNDNEIIGITVSGGKDSVYVWKWLVDKLGGSRVVAFNHNKTGLVHECAYQNLYNASSILNSKLITINDDQFLERFKQNIKAFLKKPDPAMVRVALCAGCRAGITNTLYNEGKKMGIRKFVSAASYLELAPFKGNLISKKGDGNSKYGLIKGLAENSLYCFDDNIEIILRDDNLEYKNKTKLSNSIDGDVALFDFDDYFENDPSYYEEVVKQHLNWNRPERSWHFDCLIEQFKDFFYYGLLGYTESDYKLCQMIRYNLIDREEALLQLAVNNAKIINGLDDMLKLINILNIHDIENDILSFYNKSDYFSGANI